MSTANIDDPVLKQIQELTDAATDLIDATNVSKASLDKAEKTAVESAKTASADATSAEGSAVRAEAAENRADKIAGLETVRDALREAAVPFPDFWLPLNDSLQILSGEGQHDQIDVSAAQDGSVMIDLPTKSAQFSRATTATYVDKSGVLRTAGINEPRFEKEGVLIEGSSTNLIPYSNGSSYSTAQGAQKQEVTDVLAPDGSNAYFFTGMSKNKGERLTTSIVLGDVNGKTFTHSAYIKGTNLSAGKQITMAVGRASGDSENSNSGVRVNLSSEWQRVSVTHTIPEVGGYQNIKATFAYVDGDADEFYLGCCQLEELPFESSYIPTRGSAVTRAGDQMTLANLGYAYQTCSFNILSKGVTESFRGVVSNICGNTGRVELSKTLIAFYRAKDGNTIPNLSIKLGEPNFEGSIVVTSNGNHVKGYSNGTLMGESYSDVFMNSKSPVIFNYHGVSFFHLRNFCTWNSPFTDTQVAAL